MTKTEDKQIFYDFIGPRDQTGAFVYLGIPWTGLVLRQVAARASRRVSGPHPGYEARQTEDVVDAVRVLVVLVVTQIVHNVDVLFNF